MEITPPPPTTVCIAPPTCSAAPQTPPAELEQADFLAIDDLLDFSNDEIGGPIDPCPSTATSCDLKLEAAASLTFDRKLSSQPCAFDSDSLCLPCDDLAELEWLSNFVEESFSSRDTPACLRDFAAYTGLCNDNNASHSRSSDESFRTTSPVSVLEASAFPSEKNWPPFSFGPDILSVPGRARSKRCRTAVCFWNTRILCAEVSESLLETASTTCAFRTGPSESDMYSSYYDYDDENEDGARANDEADDDGPSHGHRPNPRVKYPSMKLKNSSYNKEKSSIKHLKTKPKKMKVEDSTPIRKCLHCATQKTPQWRAGPMGPKTLCNACGVRYKSGRLCEEYRPAASPTFSESVHSNSHRKVLEMRRQRGETGNGNGSYRYKDIGHRLNCATSAVPRDAGTAINTDVYASLAMEDKKEDRSEE